MLLSSGVHCVIIGILDMLKSVCESKGLNYDDWIKNLKENERFRVEVY